MITEAFVAAVTRRYVAAQRLELARQEARECGRYGFTVTPTMRDAVHAADLEYLQATATLDRLDHPDSRKTPHEGHSRD